MRKLFLITVTLAAAGTAQATEIGFIEDFALAEDRAKALKQLIPGTEEYYYFHCIHFQNTEQFDQVDEMLQAWIKRHNYTQRVHEIQNRQALLTYDQRPAASLDFIRRTLGIQFDHQRELLDEKPNLPTALDQELIGRATLTKRALERHKNLNGFNDAAFEWLVTAELNADRRRHLLQRLKRPDYPNLPQLVVDDLNHKNSQGFGSFEIHRQLLLAQLNACLELKPKLLNETNLVTTYISKLHPGAAVDWQLDHAQHQAYLDRLWKYVSTLAPVHNSLKAHVLYHRLVLDRAHGVYDKPRFMAYIQLPRNANYMNADYMKLEQNRRYPANLHQDFRQATLLPTVGDDERLVRSYLHHFFVKETTYAPYAAYINDIYLKHNFAETKIINGLGEPEQWYSLLPPAKYQALKERVDLDFAYTNKKVVAADQPVSLDLHIKNVKTLIVKVYKINTANFYRQHRREVNTDINLDGLVANHETTHTYAEPPLRRARRHFEFPSMNDPGVYVVDFIGNGRSSRAVVRKGTLRHLVRTGTAGQVFTVLDDQNQTLRDASLWMAGHEYRAEQDGSIIVPFSTSPGRQAVVLSHGGLSVLASFQHQAENYDLRAGIYVDREALLKRRKATVVIRPGLYLNGIPVTLSVLEDVRLAITSRDHDNVKTTKEVKDFQLFEGRESTYEFQVPGRLLEISFALNAKVSSLTQDKKVDLGTGAGFSLNVIDQKDQVEDLHLLKNDDGYVVQLLGKSGEPRADRAVEISLLHRDFQEDVDVTLQTDARGRVELGALSDIVTIEVQAPNCTRKKWRLTEDRHAMPQTRHGVAGGVTELPYMGSNQQPTRDELSLLELRDKFFVADRFDALSIKDGMLLVSGLPRGDYDLWFKRSGRHVRLRIAEGERRGNHVLGKHRHLEVRGDRPLQIDGIKVGQDQVSVQLRNASKFSRVHIFATRFVPTYSAYGEWDAVRDAEPYAVRLQQLDTLYAEGREIGDEYRYILDRKYAQKFPGNMLDRPSLLLNPWSIHKTHTDLQQQLAGAGHGAAGARRGGSVRRGGRAAGSGWPRLDFANLDFLAEASAVLANLVPDKKGLVSIPRDQLGSHQHLHVVAVDPRTTVYRSVALAEQKSGRLDLRLADGLDPEVHYTQQKQVSVVRAKQKFEIADLGVARLEAYDSLPRVYALYATLLKDPKLVEFGFILDWQKLDADERRAKYSKYACHELNFFLLNKDPEFFDAVVQPYLLNKKDKTFLDHWLLRADLSEYLKPWNHEQLNIVEQILLARRINGEPPRTARHVADLFDLTPPNVQRFDFLFRTALKGSALEANDVSGRVTGVISDYKARFDARSEIVQPDDSDVVNVQDALDMAVEEVEHAKQDDLFGEAEPTEEDVAADPFSGKEQPPQREQQRQRKMLKDIEHAKKEIPELEERTGERDEYFDEESDRRKRVRQLYRKLDKTEEWVENNYYHLPIEKQNADLVTVNAFWDEYAQHDPQQPFYSVHLAEASRNFTEVMFALAVLDLPMQPEQHETQIEETKLTLTPAGPMVVFHEEIKPAQAADEQAAILVSQNFFRHDDRYRYVNNQKLDKYVTDELLAHTLYGAQVVVTNPTSAPQELDVLLQVPTGSMPVLGARYTRTEHVDLGPFQTRTIEYHFYFPAAGSYAHYPVHVARDGQLLAHAEPATLKVVEKLSRIDRESWNYISQRGSNADVIKFLNQHNLRRIDLERIAWRMQDATFFKKVIALLARRHIYDHTLWSYAIKHNVAPAVREYLQHADALVQQCGSYIDSPLLVIDPVARKTYQHMAYRPLVNARAHQLGRRRQIPNQRFATQYRQLLQILGYRRQPDDDDLMSVTYYLLLQDRIEEAIDFFGRINAERLATRLQYDYFTAYLDFYNDEPSRAAGIAQRYANYPVDRWRNAFANITVQLDELAGKQLEIVDAENRTQSQSNLATTAPNFEFTVEARQVRVDYQNLKQIQVNYYVMDIELLFSRNPFAQKFSGQFSSIHPNVAKTVTLPVKGSSHKFDLPAELHNRNVLIEVSGGGQAKTQPYFSNSLAVQTVENYGQLRVVTSNPGKPIPKVYVKVYAQMQDGSVKFYKDGYTDLRGRFDYSSLNTNQLDFVSKFALLILSEDHGAVVREANPPKR